MNTSTNSPLIAKIPEVHLICTFEPERLNFVPQFVQHYRALGVEYFHFSLHLDPDVSTHERQRRAEAAERTLCELGLVLRSIFLCPFTPDAIGDHHREIQRALFDSKTWIVWADIDEFQIYPAPLGALLQFAEERDIHYFWGLFVDRIAVTGRMSAFNPSDSIWSQYPLRCRISRDVARAYDRKVTSARSAIPVTGGNHHPLWNGSLRYLASPIEIHHFKWDLGAGERILARSNNPELGLYRLECARVVQHLQQSGGYLVSRNAVQQG